MCLMSITCAFRLRCTQHTPCAGTLDAIIDTVSAEHDINAGISLLAPRGHYVVVGLPPVKPTLNHQAMIMNCLSFAGSSVGNTSRAQVCVRLGWSSAWAPAGYACHCVACFCTPTLALWSWWHAARSAGCTACHQLAHAKVLHQHVQWARTACRNFNDSRLCVH